MFQLGVADYSSGMQTVTVLNKSQLKNAIHNYTVAYNSEWYIWGHEETDGEPGREIIIIADGPVYSNTGERFIILQKRSQQLNQLPVFETGEASVWLYKVVDLDGQPGCELVFLRRTYYPNSYEFIC